MPDLKDREIFAVGKWNGLEFSEEDLDDIVANYSALAETHKVPLKFGHNTEQPITDGQPAIGWISRVYRNGKKLFADFSNVPNVVIEAIKNKLYRTVSIELLFGVDHKGKRFNHVLDAVALLGADQPAVNTLADLETLLATRTSFSGGRRLVFETIAGKKVTLSSEEDEMDKEEVNKLIAAALKPLSDANSTLEEENKALKAKAEKLEREQADFAKKEADKKVADARKAVNDVLDTAVKDKQMTPAVREIYSKQIGVDDDARVVTIDVDSVKLMCSATKGADTTQNGRDKGGNVDGDESAESQLITKTYENMASTGEKDFAASFARVAAANPKLHREYLDSNGVKGERS